MRLYVVDAMIHCPEPPSGMKDLFSSCWKSPQLSNLFRNCLIWRQLPFQVAFTQQLIKPGHEGLDPRPNMGQLWWAMLVTECTTGTTKALLDNNFSLLPLSFSFPFTDVDDKHSLIHLLYFTYPELIFPRNPIRNYLWQEWSEREGAQMEHWSWGTIHLAT